MFGTSDWLGQAPEKAPVVGKEQVDIADDRCGAFGQRIQHADESVGESAHRRLVEQIGRVRQHTCPVLPFRGGGHNDSQVLLRGNHR